MTESCLCMAAKHVRIKYPPFVFVFPLLSFVKFPSPIAFMALTLTMY